jgi:hypothetical protein
MLTGIGAAQAAFIPVGRQVTTGTAGQIPVYSGTLAVGPDVNLDDGVTTPATITSQLPIAMPQANLTGTGGLNIIGPGGTLPTPGANNGGIGIATGAIPQINPNNAGWFAIPYITVGGTALANTANNTNFSNTTPAAPTNGLNISWQFSGQNISAAIVGDGNAAHALCGTGSFGACTAGGATALSGLTAATGANTIANGNNPQTWNWALTSNTQTGLLFGETSAATNGTYTNNIPNQLEVQISTAAGSTASPLLITNSLTGTQTSCTLCVTSTWNVGSSIVDALIFGNVTNTASGATSKLLDLQVANGSEFSIDRVGNVYAVGNYAGQSTASNNFFCGGSPVSCSSSSNAIAGGATFQGSDNSSNGSSAKAGYSILRSGMLTNATPNAAALEGVTQLGIGYLKGSAIAAVGDVVCGTTTAFTVTDCSHTGPAVNVIGIATNTANPVGVVADGTALVKTDGAVTIGDVLCMGVTTDGQAHDNGTAACATAGTTIGVVVATSGTITQMSGNSTASTAMSTTLPLVQLHIGK